MIKFENVEQQTLEWFELKWGKIGGTDSKSLLTGKYETLFYRLLQERLEEFEPSEGFSNEAMERGNELEPFAREYLSNYLGVEFKEYGWLQSSSNELIGISPDGLTEDETISCEIKCLGGKAHYSILINDEIPLDKIAQCIHYFTINPKLEKHYFLAFRPEAPKHFIKELNRESLVNIGTDSKKVLKTIKECVDLSNKNAEKLLNELKEKELNLLEL